MIKDTKLFMLKLETVSLNLAAECLNGKLRLPVTERENMKEHLVDQPFIYSLHIKDYLESTELCFLCSALNP